MTGPLLLVIVAALLAGCGGATPTPTATGGAGTPGPRPPSWPGTAVLAIVKLGGIDGEIAKAGRDFITASEVKDVALMWGAADGLTKVIGDLDLSVEHLAAWDRTAVLAGHLATAYPLMLDGATLLRDSIVAGDADGVEEGSRQLAAGLTAYAPARPILAELVPEALLQQRNLNL